MRIRVERWAALATSALFAACAAAGPSASIAPRPCATDAAAKRAAGDLDGALDALSTCSEPTLGERLDRAELLLVVGDVAEAKAIARDVLADGRAATDASVLERATVVLTSADPPPPSKAEQVAAALAMARGAPEAPRSARLVALAKARHALTRATGEAGEPCVVERVDADGGWGADHPLWPVIVHPTAPDQADVFDRVAIGVIEPSGVRIDRLLPWHDDPFGDVQRLGPTAFALRSSGGIRVLFAAGDPPPLDVDGTMTRSSKGDLFAVATEEGVAVFSVEPFERRFTLEAAGSGRPSFTPDERFLVKAASHPGALVGGIVGRTYAFDLETRSRVVDEPGYGALSTSGATLAIVQASDIGVRLRLFTLGASSAPRDVELPVQVEGALFARFMSEDRVAVIEGRGAMQYSERTVAVVDVPTARIVAEREPTPLTEPPLRALLPKSRALVPAAVSPPLGPLASGLVAAVTTEKPCASVCAPSLLVADTHAKRVLVDVPLATRGVFLVQRIEATRDERFLVACGASDAVTGAFVVDLEGIRWSFTGAIDACDRIPIEGHRVWTRSGVVDLDGVEGRPWPSVLVAPLASSADVVRSPPLPDGPGRYCRFGEVLAPLEVCGPATVEATRADAAAPKR
ncbi:MAG: hypothetical protein U0414_36345 [Polyangiaceae bacterium]